MMNLLRQVYFIKAARKITARNRLVLLNVRTYYIRYKNELSVS